MFERQNLSERSSARIGSLSASRRGSRTHGFVREDLIRRGIDSGKIAVVINGVDLLRTQKTPQGSRIDLIQFRLLADKFGRWLHRHARNGARVWRMSGSQRRKLLS